MKAREVRELLRGKIDPTVLKVLEAQADDISMMKGMITGIVKNMSRLIDNHQELARVMGIATLRLDAMKNDNKEIQSTITDERPNT